MQVKKLEVIDARRNVRAVLSAEGKDGVSLRFLSEDKKPIVVLGVGAISKGSQSDAASGSLVIANADGRQAIELRTSDTGEGSLTFSSARIPDQVIVGYSRYGDYDDGHNRGAWGIQITGPEHSKTGVNVFTKDGILQGPTIPLEAPILRRR
jgi:hypothetical protein